MVREEGEEEGRVCLFVAVVGGGGGVVVMLLLRRALHDDDGNAYQARPAAGTRCGLPIRGVPGLA
jgi:hypothetical protein